MAKRNKKAEQPQLDNKEVDNIEVVEAETVKPTVKKKLPTKEYELKVRKKISGVWKQKGEKISLTKEGFRFFRSKKWI